MFLVANRIGAYEDKETWTDIVSPGKLRAYLEAKRANPLRRNHEGDYHLFVVTNFGSYQQQTATAMPEDPESLFAQNGESVQIAVLQYEDSTDSDSLRLTITLITDDAFEQAISNARRKLSDAGWCPLELKI